MNSTKIAVAVPFLCLVLSCPRVGAQCANPSTGPDVIVGNLMDMSNYGKVGNINAYDIGTESCNIGTVNVLWQDGNNLHPVIGQNMYRLKNGRFEQVGMSWLKHGFTALTNSLCCTCNGQGGPVLGVGCSDPYCCGLNGSQGRLGARSQVNAATGVYVWPHDTTTGNAVYKRLQIKDADLDPALNAGALYFGECQYVTQDDATAGNKNNNASYRQATLAVSGTTYNFSFGTSLTQRTKPAILAWHDQDPAVQTVNVDIPNDGRLIVAWKVTNPSIGMYHYEYAIENITSDRSVQSVVFPTLGAVITNTDFHDVDYHSGEPYSLADWTKTQASGNVTFATELFAANQNANALRWGTMYNFRFDATTAPLPTLTNATISLFKPGTPTQVTFATQVPGPADCNNNGVLDNIDIANGTSQDCNNNGVPDECELATNDCNGNGIPDDCELAGHDCDGNGIHDSCQLVNNDCDGNGVPDNCQADCNHDGVIDACAIIAGAEDCNGNGVPDSCDVNVPSTTANPNQAIPDNNPAGIGSVVFYAGSGTVTDVNATVHIPHTAVSDLHLELAHGATTVVLWDNRCGSFDNLNVTFDDAGGFINCSNLTGTYRPNSSGGAPLASFNGLSAGGPWTLTVSDRATGNTGTLQSWTLNVTSTIPPTPPLPDVNHNGVPDSCECLACKGDANHDGHIDGKDVALMASAMITHHMNHCLDMDNNLAIDQNDLTAFMNAVLDPNPPCAP